MEIKINDKSKLSLQPINTMVKISFVLAISNQLDHVHSHKDTKRGEQLLVHVERQQLEKLDLI